MTVEKLNSMMRDAAKTLADYMDENEIEDVTGYSGDTPIISKKTGLTLLQMGFKFGVNWALGEHNIDKLINKVFGDDSNS